MCNDCPAFIATENNDLEQKVKLSQEWSSSDYQVSPEDVNCTGCNIGSETVFKFCKECEIRMCGIERGIENCGYCSEYPCSKLDIPFNNSPENKERLDQINKKL
ncbi:DUF3795 domain-containing protein [Proteiniborus sp. DW1]|uniref:DUF3795 domain-containing protein n=1 Tax=Proteiniborus sp. DW1 TaxID=1889883 RepID=UPI0009F873B8|nr:DUF3795 domain-containing protein [Proteiniborus sp. DW1]